MSILHYRIGGESQVCTAREDDRYQRDALGDLKHGFDLIFELKTKLDKMHPIAAETLIRLLSH